MVIKASLRTKLPVFMVPAMIFFAIARMLDEGALKMSFLILGLVCALVFMLDLFFLQHGTWRFRAARDGFRYLGRFFSWHDIEECRHVKTGARPGGELRVRFRNRPWWAQESQAFPIGEPQVENAKRIEQLYADYVACPRSDVPPALVQEASGDAFRGVELDEVSTERIADIATQPTQDLQVRVRAAQVLVARGESEVVEEVEAESMNPALVRALRKTFR